VGGRLGENAGRRMIAGSLFGFGPVGPGIGHGMKRGTIGLFGNEPGLELSAAFEPSGSFRPHFLSIFLDHIQRLGLNVPPSASRGPVRRYNGDRIEGGRGEILVAGCLDG
jgi:formylmethanofuran dehydrogenase subunit C